MYMGKVGCVGVVYIEQENSLSEVCFSCSSHNVREKVGRFYEHSLLIERIGFNSIREKGYPLASILRRYIIAYSSTFVEDEAVIVLIMTQEQNVSLNKSRSHWQTKIKKITYNVRNLTERVMGEVFRRFVFTLGDIDRN